MTRVYTAWERDGDKINICSAAFWQVPAWEVTTWKTVTKDTTKMNEREIDWPELIQDMTLAVLEIQV